MILNFNLIICVIAGVVLFVVTIYDLKNKPILKDHAKVMVAIVITILCITVIMERIRYGFNDTMFLQLFLIYDLIILSIYDIREKSLPIKWLILGLLLGVLCLETNADITFLEGILTASISILIIALLSKSTRGGIGLGDGIVIALLGLSLGWQLTFSIFILSLLISSAWGIVLLIMKKVHKKSMLPFVPFILAATCIILWV